MAIPSLLNTYIDETYQRLVQTTGSGAEFADGLGNPINLVTKINAGSGITISPSSGVGNVTINSSAGAYNTATGSYGSFYDTGSYAATSATAIYSMSLNTTDISNGVFISGSDNTKIKFTNAGVYNIQFSAQFANSDNVGVDVAIWLRKNNGSSVDDLADTTGICTVPPFKAGQNGQTITSWNYYVNVVAGDFLQLLWHAAVANKITLETIAAGTNPVHPRTPSLILTANRIDTFLSNTGSFSGSFNGSHSGSFTGSFTGSLFGTASWANNATTSSYVSTLRAAGNDTEIQYNNGGVLGAAGNFAYGINNIRIGNTRVGQTTLISNNESGVQDNDDRAIAVLERNSDTYYYGNGNYKYDNLASAHSFTGSLSVLAGGTTNFTTQTDLIKTAYNGTDSGLYIDFANNQFGIVNNPIAQEGVWVNLNNPSAKGVYLGFGDSAQSFIAVENTVIRTNYNSADIGLKLDFSGNVSILGTSSSPGDLWAKGILVDNSNSIFPQVIIGDSDSDNPGNKTQIRVSDGGSFIKTLYNNADNGLKLDFASRVYSLGEPTTNNFTNISVNDVANTITLTGNVLLPNLTNSAQSNVVVYNAGSQQLYYRPATEIGSIKTNGTTLYSDNPAAGPSYSTDNSIILGTNAGYLTTGTSNNVVLGAGAGSGASSASYSNFIGNNTGYSSVNASLSTLIGFQAGLNPSTPSNSIGSNNIIIGTNITLPAGRKDSINLGGIIFATGSYSNTGSQVFNGTSNGKVGINVVSPNYTLDVSGSGNYTNGLTVTGSLVATSFTGSLQGTSSWATNSLTASYLNTLKASSASIASFGGSPLTASVTFGSAYSDNNYSISIIGQDARIFTVQSKTSGSFVINTNSTVALTGPVYWTATPFNP